MFLFALALIAPAAQTPDAVPEKPKKERRICRGAQETGSRMGGGRVCKTKEEWAKIDGGNFAGIDRATNDNQFKSVNN